MTLFVGNSFALVCAPVSVLPSTESKSDVASICPEFRPLRTRICCIFVYAIKTLRSCRPAARVYRFLLLFVIIFGSGQLTKNETGGLSVVEFGCILRYFISYFSQCVNIDAQICLYRLLLSAAEEEKKEASGLGSETAHGWMRFIPQLYFLSNSHTGPGWPFLVCVVVCKFGRDQESAIGAQQR